MQKVVLIYESLVQTVVDLTNLVTKKLQDVSKEIYILELQRDKFDDKILFDISKSCEK